MRSGAGNGLVVLGKLPVLIRLPMVVALSYAISRLLLGIVWRDFGAVGFWQTNSFLPAWFAVIASLAVATVVLAPRSTGAAAPQQGEA